MTIQSEAITIPEYFNIATLRGKYRIPCCGSHIYCNFQECCAFLTQSNSTSKNTIE